MEHLEQISTVFPEAYKFSPVKEVIDDGCRVDSVTVEMLDTCEQKTETDGFFQPWGEQLRQRREEFHKRLVELVKVEHKVFKLQPLQVWQ